MTRLRYGSDPSQFADLYLPAEEAVTPVAVIVHGGFWRDRYDLSIGEPLARDLVRHGVAALNIEYRRVGSGGGWPSTLRDVAAAVDLLASVATEHRLDLDRVAGLGHSAGGQLVGWLAARSLLPTGAPGAEPRVRLCAFVSQAGVLDLDAADELNLGDSATATFLGGHHDQVPTRYAQASPLRLLPTGLPSVLVHPTADEDVPVELSRHYHCAAVEAGDDCRLIETGGDHMAVVTIDDPAWTTCRDATLALLSG